MRLRCCVADRRKETDKANPLLLLMLASLLSKPSIALSILPTTSPEGEGGLNDIDPRALEMLVSWIIKSISVLERDEAEVDEATSRRGSGASSVLEPLLLLFSFAAAARRLSSSSCITDHRSISIASLINHPLPHHPIT